MWISEAIRAARRLLFRRDQHARLRQLLEDQQTAIAAAQQEMAEAQRFFAETMQRNLVQSVARDSRFHAVARDNQVTSNQNHSAFIRYAMACNWGLDAVLRNLRELDGDTDGPGAKPWTWPNADNQRPGGPCCQATGAGLTYGYCSAHTEANYSFVDGQWQFIRRAPEPSPAGRTADAVAAARGDISRVEAEAVRAIAQAQLTLVQSTGATLAEATREDAETLPDEDEIRMPELTYIPDASSRDLLKLLSELNIDPAAAAQALRDRVAQDEADKANTQLEQESQRQHRRIRIREDRRGKA